MNKNLKVSLAVVIMLMALFFCVHMCDSFISKGRTQNLLENAFPLLHFIEENAQLRKEIDILRELRNANHGVLHRIWVDNPVYFEDVLTESDEWCSLMDIMNHDTEDLFEFWSEQDSISYTENCHN